ADAELGPFRALGEDRGAASRNGHVRVEAPERGRTDLEAQPGAGDAVERRVGGGARRRLRLVARVVRRVQLDERACDVDARVPAAAEPQHEVGALVALDRAVAKAAVAPEPAEPDEHRAGL